MKDLTNEELELVYNGVMMKVNDDPSGRIVADRMLVEEEIDRRKLKIVTIYKLLKKDK